MKTPVRLTVRSKKLLADTYTPVSMYLQLRDVFPGSVLLESSDYHGNEDSISYICCQPIAGFVVENFTISERYPDGTLIKTPIQHYSNVLKTMARFMESFSTDRLDIPLFHSGLFGYSSYSAVQYFEDIELRAGELHEETIPVIQYHLYRFVIALNHFTNELYIIEHQPENAPLDEYSIEYIESLVNQKTFARFHFVLSGAETSNFTDEAFLLTLNKVKEHIFRGDVFQIVPSRRFQRPFKGDDFNVYRALRSINPSPYLFYFDYGSAHLFGSSPEAQLVVRGSTAEIHPIAGTFRRTGNDETDRVRAAELQNDPKENAEHVMLVDLARNDLSRHCHNVRVEVYREIQFYSHVIHLVSKVTGTITNRNQRLKSSLRIMADTFPAGTLSGAPKYKAMELIDRYERSSRGFYAGCVGFLDFNGDSNQAIMIRSFMSKNNLLTYQAGAGLVANSVVENELQEVQNKLAALKKALELAETL